MQGIARAQQYWLAMMLLIAALSLSISGTATAATFDINKASAAEIEKSLIGVGPKKAKAIVDYRRKNGSFKTTDDLLKVPGIGPATVGKNFKALNLRKGSTPLSAKKAPAKKAPAKKAAAKAKTDSVKKKKTSTTAKATSDDKKSSKKY